MAKVSENTAVFSGRRVPVHLKSNNFQGQHRWHVHKTLFNIMASEIIVRGSVTFLGLNSLGGSGARQSAGSSEYGVAVVFRGGGGYDEGRVGRGTRAG